MEKVLADFFEKYDNLIIAAVFCSVAVIAFLSILFYVRLRKRELYSYRRVSLLGGSIFLVAMLLAAVISLPAESLNITRSLYFIHNIANTADYFVLLALPLALLFLLFMGASNLSLIRHEGKSVRNLVGTVLSFVFFFSTIAAFFGWDILYDKIIFEIYARGCRWISIFDIGIPCFLVGIICYFECLLIATIVCSLKAIKTEPAYDKDYVIILGCQVRKDGTPTPLLRGRIDRALEFAKAQEKATGKAIKFVPSGGKGDDECISEAESMKNYLLSQGIREEDILTENKSVSTLENMQFSKKLIEQDSGGGNIIYSTTNYHVFRSGVYAGKAGLKAQGIGNKTKWYFWPNAFAREFIALVAGNLRGHIANILVILVESIIAGYLNYIMVG